MNSILRGKDPHHYLGRIFCGRILTSDPGCVGNDPEWDTNAARVAIHIETANHASKRTWDRQAREWETAIAKYAPDMEFSHSFESSTIKWTARIVGSKLLFMVALGDNARDKYGRLVEE